MPVRTIHFDYIARIVLKIFPQREPSLLKEEAIPGWAYGVMHFNGDEEQLAHRYMQHQSPPYLLFLEDVTEQHWLIEYLLALCEHNTRLPDGGLVFIDRATGELIETNWELGETEEWAEILEDLPSTGTVLHTFSATDAAIEVRSVSEGVLIQPLNWEAVPERLTTSRRVEPQHVFENQAIFISQVQQCLARLDLLISEAQKLSGNCYVTIRDYLSVAHR